MHAVLCRSAEGGLLAAGKSPETPLRLVLETAVGNRPISRDIYHEFLQGAIKNFTPGMLIYAYSNGRTAAMRSPPLAGGRCLARVMS